MYSSDSAENPWPGAAEAPDPGNLNDYQQQPQTGPAPQAEPTMFSWESNPVLMAHATASLGQNVHDFASIQQSMFMALEGITQTLAQLNAAPPPIPASFPSSVPSGISKFHAPTPFNEFVSAIDNAIYLLRSQLPTDYDKCLYFRTYLGSGSPTL